MTRHPPSWPDHTRPRIYEPELIDDDFSEIGRGTATALTWVMAGCFVTTVLLGLLVIYGVWP